MINNMNSVRSSYVTNARGPFVTKRSGVRPPVVALKIQNGKRLTCRHIRCPHAGLFFISQTQVKPQNSPHFPLLSL